MSEASNKIKDTEISLLKQEILIVKTKLVQTEADNKDLERKNKILSEALRIHENKQNEALRRKCFPETDPTTSPEPSDGSFSAQAPTRSRSRQSTTSYNLEGNTIDRLIIYFLNVIEHNQTSGTPKDLPHSKEPTTNSNSGDDNISKATSASPPTPPDEPVEDNPVDTEIVPADASMGTIDEFCDEITPELETANQNLNCPVLTIQ